MPEHSIQSINYPDRFIRHQDFLGELTPINTDLDRQDATFGLTDAVYESAEIRFESFNFINSALRHQDFRIKLDEYPEPGLHGFDYIPSPAARLFAQDSTFALVRGLADPSAFSFRSVNYPDRYIRHRNFHLFLDPRPNFDDVLGKQDATFRSEAPLYVPVIHGPH